MPISVMSADTLASVQCSSRHDIRSWMADLCRDHCLTDLVISTCLNRHTVQAHWNMVAMFSSLLRDIQRETAVDLSQINGDGFVLLLPDRSPATVESLVRMIYTGCVRGTEAHCREVVNVLRDLRLGEVGGCDNDEHCCHTGEKPYEKRFTIELDCRSTRENSNVENAEIGDGFASCDANSGTAEDEIAIEPKLEEKHLWLETTPPLENHSSVAHQSNHCDKENINGTVVNSQNYAGREWPIVSSESELESSCKFTARKITPLKPNGGKTFKHNSRSYSTSQKSNIPTHMSARSREKSLSCSISSNSTSHRGNLDVHMLANGGSLLFSCKHCSFRCSKKRDLHSHLKQAHHDDAFQRCELCPYKTVDNQSLKYHVVATHQKLLRPFKCNSCDYTAVRRLQLRIHQRSHTGEKPFVCHVCPFSCKSKASLDQHLKVHSSVKMYKCAQCAYATNRRGNLALHQRRHTGEKLFFCEKCAYSTYAQQNFRNHLLRTHGNNGKKDFRCDQCAYASNYRSNLSKHTAARHGQKEAGVIPTMVRNSVKRLEHKCESCLFSCSTEESLKMHMTSVHAGEKSDPVLICRLCSYWTGDSAAMKQHRIDNHTSEKPKFKCSDCDYEASQKVYLTNHVNAKHKDRKPFACSYEKCEYSAAVKQLLTTHLRKHTGEKPYQCSCCPFATQSQIGLKQHLAVHSLQKPFKCSVCSFASNRRATLTLHNRTHTGEGLFHCERCSSFSSYSKANLKQHLRTHTGEKPYACDKCDYSAKWKRNLTKHLESHNT